MHSEQNPFGAEQLPSVAHNISESDSGEALYIARQEFFDADGREVGMMTTK